MNLTQFWCVFASHFNDAAQKRRNDGELTDGFTTTKTLIEAHSLGFKVLRWMS